MCNIDGEWLRVGGVKFKLEMIYGMFFVEFELRFCVIYDVFGGKE